MKFILTLTLLVASLASCKKSDTPVVPTPTTARPEVSTELPSCIQQKIDAILTEPVRNPPARILRFTYNGQTAYYLPAYCCDQYSELYDDSCNLLCHPDGGITGGGDGQCANFWSTAIDSVEIWRDPR